MDEVAHVLAIVLAHRLDALYVLLALGSKLRLGLQLLVDLTKQLLVEGELVRVHLRLLGRLVDHLLQEELLVLLVDRVNAALETRLLLLPVVLVDLPHLGLSVDVADLLGLSHFLVLHLLPEELAHLDLVIFEALLLRLHQHVGALFHFRLIAIDHLLFEGGPVLHLLEHSVGKAVLEDLSALLTLLHLILSVHLLSFEHLGVSLLSGHIVLAFLVLD